MPRQTVGDVRGQSIGGFFPLIVVMYGDGTSRIHWGTLRSRAIKRLEEAHDLATFWYECIQEEGYKAAKGDFGEVYT